MAWNNLTFTGGAVLTAAELTQVQENFSALAQGAAGAPPITPCSLMWSGQASGAALQVSSLTQLRGLEVSDVASLAALVVAGASTSDHVTLTGAPAGIPTPHTAYADPSSGSVGWALPMNPAGSVPSVALVLTATQGGVTAGSLETWHEVGASGEPAFQNAWANFGSGNATAAFRKLADGTVWLKGLIKGGTVGIVPAFILPAGYRPTAKLHFVASNPAGGSLANTVVSASVDAAGNVQIEAAANNNSASLTPIAFMAGA